MRCTGCSTRSAPASPSGRAATRASSSWGRVRATPPRWPTSSSLTTSPPRARSVSLGLPHGWVDRSVLTYVGPDTGSGSPSLVVSSDELEDGTALGAYAAMQDGAVRAGFSGIELLEDRETAVGGRGAVRRTYR